MNAFWRSHSSQNISPPQLQHDLRLPLQLRLGFHGLLGSSCLTHRQLHSLPRVPLPAIRHSAAAERSVHLLKRPTFKGHPTRHNSFPTGLGHESINKHKPHTLRLPTRIPRVPTQPPSTARSLLHRLRCPVELWRFERRYSEIAL